MIREPMRFPDLQRVDSTTLATVVARRALASTRAGTGYMMQALREPQPEQAHSSPARHKTVRQGTLSRHGQGEAEKDIPIRWELRTSIQIQPSGNMTLGFTLPTLPTSTRLKWTSTMSEPLVIPLSTVSNATLPIPSGNTRPMLAGSQCGTIRPWHVPRLTGQPMSGIMSYSLLTGTRRELLPTIQPALTEPAPVSAESGETASSPLDGCRKG